VNKYLICTAYGGVMEHPGFSYTDKDVIFADTETEARGLYKKKYKLEYWFPEVIATIINGVTKVLNKSAVTYQDIEELEKAIYVEPPPTINDIKNVIKDIPPTTLNDVYDGTYSRYRSWVYRL
jgi:hypothetical protein